MPNLRATDSLKLTLNVGYPLVRKFLNPHG